MPVLSRRIVGSEIGFRPRSRFAPGLDVPDNVRLALSLAAVFLDACVERPGEIGVPEDSIALRHLDPDFALRLTIACVS